jgi:hypothetical protein
MARFGLALALVLAISTTAMAGNGSRKIRSFAPAGSTESPDVDGVGVISFAPGTNETSVHVAITDHNPNDTYRFYALLTPGDLDSFVLISDLTTNSAGNGNAKVSVDLGADFSGFIMEVAVVRVDPVDGEVLVAVSTEISN